MFITSIVLNVIYFILFLKLCSERFFVLNDGLEKNLSCGKFLEENCNLSYK